MLGGCGLFERSIHPPSRNIGETLRPCSGQTWGTQSSR